MRLQRERKREKKSASLGFANPWAKCWGCAFTRWRLSSPGAVVPLAPMVDFTVPGTWEEKRLAQGMYFLARKELTAT